MFVPGQISAHVSFADVSECVHLGVFQQINAISHLLVHAIVFAFMNLFLYVPYWGNLKAQFTQNTPNFSLSLTMAMYGPFKPYFL